MGVLETFVTKVKIEFFEDFLNFKLNFNRKTS